MALRFLMVACFGLAMTATAKKVNPISRIVDMMEGLTKKIEAEGKAEEDLWEGYVCWYKTVLSTKKAAISQAKDRIDALSSYVEDVKGGAIEFTTERADLAAEIEKLTEDIRASEQLRKKETEDYEAAKDEMERGIAALEKAVGVMEEGKGAAASSLAGVSFDVRRVVELGRNSLSKEDTELLEAALDQRLGEPVKSAAAAKSAKYRKTGSRKIEDLLKDLLQTFRDNLADATEKEEAAEKTSATLLEQKKSALAAAQDAYSAGNAEADARNLQLQEAEEESTALKAQSTDNEKYISEADKAYEEMADAWKERKRLRSEEVESIQKAIAVLTSDEAKDTMLKSFKASMLLQEKDSADSACLSARVQKASQHLREIAEKQKSSRLAMLAVAVKFRTKGNFDAVVDGIEKVIHDIHKENDQDLKVKEDCEEDRDKNTKAAKNQAYKVDQETSLIVRKEGEIDAKNKEIDRLNGEKAELELQQQEAKIAREKEALEYKHNKAADEEARGLITKAKEVLEKFYSDNQLALAQQAHKSLAKAPVAAAEPPPPPPTTWSEPYGGAKSSTGGVTAILDMVSADIEKDQKEAEVEEKAAIAEHEAFLTSTGDIIKGLDEDVTAIMGEIGEAEEVIKDARLSRGDAKKVMDESMMYLRSIAEGCDFMAANFEFRKQNREAETDGLIEAEAMLTGGEKGAFSKALLQDASMKC